MCIHIYFLALSCKRTQGNNIPVATNTTSTQIFVSKHGPIIKRTRTTWRNVWLKAGAGKV